jgi:hypothetical protein
MTYEFEYLMHLLSCGARGTSPEPPCQPVDYDRIMQLAQEQSIAPLIGAALSNAAYMGLPNEKVQGLVKNTRNLALTNYIKKRKILKLLQDFEDAGIQAVLLKGYALADLYFEPNCRISSDIDIYISIKDEKKAYLFLEEHGCKVYPRTPTSHHAICEHPQMGLIELHVILYDEIVEDVWFGRKNDQQFIQEAFEKHVTEDGSYLTLGKTDNAIFIVLHMIKHFILSGTSLRQMMDIALYFEKYKAQIDFRRIWNMLESLKYRILMNTVLNSMVSYCGFSPEDFAGYEKADEEAISVLLADLEDGGWLGSKNTQERNNSWHRYNLIRYKEKRNLFSYWCYMIKRITLIHMPEIFPSKGVLKRKYPYTEKFTLLTPIAWLQHLLTGCVKLFSGKLDTEIEVRKDQLYDEKRDRSHLFKLMQIM